MIGSVPQGITGLNGALWVSVRGTATSHRGGTLSSVSLEQPYTLDPGSAYDVLPWRVLHLLGDGLVAFEPISTAFNQLGDLDTGAWLALAGGILAAGGTWAARGIEMPHAAPSPA